VIEALPHVNASLNALATVLLVIGYLLIKRRQEAAHKWTMLACFGVSTVFLASYLTYHFNIPGGSKRFPGYPPDWVRYGYYAILLTHVVLAAAVPFLAVASIWLGLVDRRRLHTKLSWWTFPIWLYVSITGVIVYLLLYQLYPPREIGARLLVNCEVLS
jgi:putative membrane protein